jgi:2-oxoglutarate dehydrogenase E1 component
MKDFSYITSAHPSYIENLYTEFIKNPESVDPDMRRFFEGFDFAISNGKNGNENGSAVVTPAAQLPADIDWMQEIRIYRMILGYRNKGHLLAKTNPIRPRKDRGANIELQFYGFTDADLDKEFQAGKLIGLGTTTLRNIFNFLEKC